MKFTLTWLKEHLETDATLEQITDSLTALGLEVEHVENYAEKLSAFSVAEVKEAHPHPDADKLQICRVHTGKEIVQIVCGAPNARAGLKVVLAREGTVIPANNMVIKKTKIRGVESNGMLCSADELGVGADSKGIIELPHDAQVGAPAASLLGYDDAMIEIAITPNRADALGVYGIARDLAAAGLGTLKPLPIPTWQGNGDSKVRVDIETPELCTYFIGCTITGVRNVPSPDWLQARLKLIGLRPISALVDITNYFTHTYSRPLHVYDTEPLEGNIVVRAAEGGETLSALNDKEYTLEPGMCVIADKQKILGLGGIVGGTETGCTDSTQHVFLEAALFDPINIAETGRKLDALTDARYRFERGVDSVFTETGAWLAVQMILDICGGEASELVFAGEAPNRSHTIAITPDYVKQLGGVAVGEAEMIRTLEHIGCHVMQEGKILHVTPPSWRQDMEGKADIVEEVLRIHGYDAIPEIALPRNDNVITTQGGERDLHIRIKQALAAQGKQEVCSWSFVSVSEAELFGNKAQLLPLQNAISEALSVMRPSLIPHLLTAVAENKARCAEQLAFFEVGPQFGAHLANLQANAAVAVRAGGIVEHAYTKDTFTRNIVENEWTHAKADALTILRECGMDITRLKIIQDVPSWYHPGRSGTLTLGGKIVLGYFGEVHPAIAAEWGIKERIAVCEIVLDAVPVSRQKTLRPVLQASPYQQVARDFAFVVDRVISVDTLLQAVRSADKELLQDVIVFDVYQGDKIEAGKKSVALRVTLQANNRTLTDEEINAIADKIIVAASKRCNASLRG